MLALPLSNFKIRDEPTNTRQHTVRHKAIVKLDRGGRKGGTSPKVSASLARSNCGGSESFRMAGTPRRSRTLGASVWKYLWHGGVQLVMYPKVATASDLRTYLHMCHLRSQEEAVAPMTHMKMSLMRCRHHCTFASLSDTLVI